MPKLYAVNKEKPSTRQIARERVAAHRKQKTRPLPITNIHDRDQPAPPLRPDEVLRRTSVEYLVGRK